MVIGCALYMDALKPASLLSLTLHDNDIVQGIKHILKSHSSLKKLCVTSQNSVEWPVMYQRSELHNFRDTTTKTCQDQALADKVS